MKELAVVKLTKTLLVKVGNKVKEKREKWAKEAAASVEENKRREAEFKQDFEKIRAKVSGGKTTVKESVEKSVEDVTATSKSTAKEESVAEKEATKNRPNEQEKQTSKKESKSVTKEAKKREVKVNTEVKKTSTKKATPQTEKDTVKKEKASAPKKEKVAPKKTEKAKEKVAKTQKVASKKTANKKETGSRKEAKIALYTEDVKKHYGSVDADFLAVIVKNLGPSIYRKDAELVSCSDAKELETVRKNFLQKKLGMQQPNEELDAAIKEVCEEMKASRQKYRATFYYALAKKFNMESKLS